MFQLYYVLQLSLTIIHLFAYLFFAGATKSCESSGHWFISDKGTEWSDYQSCSALGLVYTRIRVKIASHAVSIAFLIPALIIFYSYK